MKKWKYLIHIKCIKKYSDEEHKLSISELKEKINEIYGEDIDPRMIRRNINLLKEK